MLKQEQRGPTIACIGGISIDYKLTLLNELVPETSNPVHKSTSQGGVIRNVAENMARLGLRVQLYSMIGNDADGDALLNYNQAYMDVSEIEKSPTQATANYTALVRRDGNLAFGIAAMDIFEELDEAYITRNLPCLERADYIVADMNLTKDAFNTLFNFVSNQQKKLIVVGVSAPKMERLPRNLEAVYLIITNRDEGEAYFAKPSHSDPAELANLYVAAGAEYAVVTNGAKATSYASKEQKGFVPVQPVDYVKDVTGAGDSFSGALIYGLTQGFALEEAIKLGSVNAGQTLKSALSVRDDLNEEALLNEYKVVYQV